MSQQGVKIEGNSSAAVYYGAQTLRQLVEGEGAAAVLPEVEIHDWPSMAFRGTMVDVSHGPTLASQTVRGLRSPSLSSVRTGYTRQHKRDELRRRLIETRAHDPGAIAAAAASRPLLGKTGRLMIIAAAALLSAAA